MPDHPEPDHIPNLLPDEPCALPVPARKRPTSATKIKAHFNDVMLGQIRDQDIVDITIRMIEQAKAGVADARKEILDRALPPKDKSLTASAVDEEIFNLIQLQQLSNEELEALQQAQETIIRLQNKSQEIKALPAPAKSEGKIEDNGNKDPMTNDPDQN